MEIPTLVTERLVLRPFRLEDLDAHAMMNADPRVMQHIGPVLDRAASFRSLCSYPGHWILCGYGPWAVEERATGAFIGRAGLIRCHNSNEIELAYALAPPAWGKGYALEAAGRALRYALHELGARGVVSRIAAGNAASIRVAERLGARHARDSDERVGEQLVRIYVYPDPPTV